MSGGERKKRLLPQGVRGWEEAGGEFYQESYPGAESDLEVMQTDPHRISTLLPSKKNRTATMQKDTKLSTLRHRTTLKQQYQATVPVQNDIQISLLPDLSENLSNEKLLWEEIMKIKAMPVSMSQKKELKTKLMSRDTLRLQGFKQFKWKKKLSLMQLKIRLCELNEKLTLWRGSLKKIEGYYGTGVVSFFLFLKWLIFLNVIVSLIMIVFVILPTVYVKNFNATLSATSTSAASDQIITNSSEARSASLESSSRKLLDLVFDSQSMVTSPLYYAYYDTDFRFDLYYLQINLPLAYILATIMCLSYSFVSVLKNAARGFKHQLLENQGQFYVYCNIIFSGWDFCIRNERSAKIKHKALYNEIIGRLNVEKRREEQRNRTKQEWCKLCLVRIVINIAVVVLLGCAGFVIFEAFKMSNRRASEMDWWPVKVATEFLTAGCIIFFNLLFPYVFNWLGAFEKFGPLFAVQVAIFRTILLRLSSLCVLLGSVYEKLLQSLVEPDDEMKSWESYLARELYKVLVLSVLTQLLYTFLVNFPRALLAKHCDHKLAQYLGRQEFNLPAHVLDVVYIQTIIWLGNFYAPLLPAVGVLTMLLVFYVKKFACLVNCRPASDVYYASRSHSLYMSILLISFAFSIAPWAYSIIQIQPSKKYGPFVEYGTVWSVIERSLSQLPQWMAAVSSFFISSTFVVPLLIALSLTNYYYYAVYVVNKQMVLVLKRQLILEGHDKQFLLNRLSAFIKQQQERHRPRNLN